MVVTYHDDEVRLPRDAVRFPVELKQPPGFSADAKETWPTVDGRLEYVNGRLLYMTPCGDRQGSTVADIVYLLKAWSKQNPYFVVRTNEVGMRLGGDVRAADAAIWREGEVDPPSGGFHRTPPTLAVEVAGLDETEADLRSKAQWYLSHGVVVVWIVLPESREAIVLTEAGETRHAAEKRLPACDALPGLQPHVAEFFTELD